MAIENINAREFGFRLGALAAACVNATINHLREEEIHIVNSLIEYTRPYADFFCVSLDSIYPLSWCFVIVFVEKRKFAHDTTKHISIQYGERTAALFWIAFLTTLYAHLIARGMPFNTKPAKGLRTQISAASQGIVTLEMQEQFCKEPTEEALGSLLNSLIPLERVMNPEGVEATNKAQLVLALSSALCCLFASIQSSRQAEKSKIAPVGADSAILTLASSFQVHHAL